VEVDPVRLLMKRGRGESTAAQLHTVQQREKVSDHEKSIQKGRVIRA